MKCTFYGVTGWWPEFGQFSPALPHLSLFFLMLTLIKSISKINFRCIFTSVFGLICPANNASVPHHFNVSVLCCVIISKLGKQELLLQLVLFWPVFWHYVFHQQQLSADIWSNSTPALGFSLCIYAAKRLVKIKCLSFLSSLTFSYSLGLSS